MIVIYAEKASLAKAIAAALKAGNRIAHPKEPVQCLHSQFTYGNTLTNNNSIPFQNKIDSGGSPVGHYEFTFNGEKAVLCHGVGQRSASAPIIVPESNLLPKLHFLQKLNWDRQLAGAAWLTEQPTESSIRIGI